MRLIQLFGLTGDAVEDVRAGPSELVVELAAGAEGTRERLNPLPLPLEAAAAAVAVDFIVKGAIASLEPEACLLLFT